MPVNRPRREIAPAQCRGLDMRGQRPVLSLRRSLGPQGDAHEQLRRGSASALGPRARVRPPGAERHYPPNLELEPVHLDIDLAIDLEGQGCAGTVTTDVEARRAGVTASSSTPCRFSTSAWSTAKGARSPGPTTAEAPRGLGGPLRCRGTSRLGGVVPDRSPTSECTSPARRMRILSSHGSSSRTTRPSAPALAACIDLPTPGPDLTSACARQPVHDPGQRASLGEIDNGDGTKTAHCNSTSPAQAT